MRLTKPLTLIANIIAVAVTSVLLVFTGNAPATRADNQYLTISVTPGNPASVSINWNNVPDRYTSCGIFFDGAVVASAGGSPAMSLPSGSIDVPRAAPGGHVVDLNCTPDATIDSEAFTISDGGSQSDGGDQSGGGGSDTGTAEAIITNFRVDKIVKPDQTIVNNPDLSQSYPSGSVAWLSWDVTGGASCEMGGSGTDQFINRSVNSTRGAYTTPTLSANQAYGLVCRGISGSSVSKSLAIRVSSPVATTQPGGGTTTTVHSDVDIWVDLPSDSKASDLNPGYGRRGGDALVSQYWPMPVQWRLMPVPGETIQYCDYYFDGTNQGRVPESENVATETMGTLSLGSFDTQKLIEFRCLSGLTLKDSIQIKIDPNAVGAKLTVDNEIEKSTEVTAGSKAQLYWHSSGAKQCFLAYTSSTVPRQFKNMTALMSSELEGRIDFAPWYSGKATLSCQSANGAIARDSVAIKVNGSFVESSLELKGKPKNVSGEYQTQSITAPFGDTVSLETIFRGRLDQCALTSEKGDRPELSLGEGFGRRTTLATSRPITESDTYTLHCNNDVGQTLAGTLAVNVTDAPTVDLKVKDDLGQFVTGSIIRKNVGPIDVQWSATLRSGRVVRTSCELHLNHLIFLPATAESGAEKVYEIQGEQKYNLTCYYRRIGEETASLSKSAEVNVNFKYNYLDDGILVNGDTKAAVNGANTPFKLSWWSFNATECHVFSTKLGGDKTRSAVTATGSSTSGAIDYRAGENTEYEINCKGTGNRERVKRAIVIVTPAQPVKIKVYEITNGSKRQIPSRGARVYGDQRYFGEKDYGLTNAAGVLEPREPIYTDLQTTFRPEKQGYYPHEKSQVIQQTDGSAEIKLYLVNKNVTENRLWGMVYRTENGQKKPVVGKQVSLFPASWVKRVGNEMVSVSPPTDITETSSSQGFEGGYFFSIGINPEVPRSNFIAAIATMSTESSICGRDSKGNPISICWRILSSLQNSVSQKAMTPSITFNSALGDWKRADIRFENAVAQELKVSFRATVEGLPDIKQEGVEVTLESPSGQVRHGTTADVFIFNRDNYPFGETVGPLALKATLVVVGKPEYKTSVIGFSLTPANTPLTIWTKIDEKRDCRERHADVGAAHIEKYYFCGDNANSLLDNTEKRAEYLPILKEIDDTLGGLSQRFEIPLPPIYIESYNEENAWYDDPMQAGYCPRLEERGITFMEKFLETHKADLSHAATHEFGHYKDFYNHGKCTVASMQAPFVPILRRIESNLQWREHFYALINEENWHPENRGLHSSENVLETYAAIFHEMVLHNQSGTSLADKMSAWPTEIKAAIRDDVENLIAYVMSGDVDNSEPVFLTPLDGATVDVGAAVRLRVTTPDIDVKIIEYSYRKLPASEFTTIASRPTAASFDWNTTGLTVGEYEIKADIGNVEDVFDTVITKIFIDNPSCDSSLPSDGGDLSLNALTEHASAASTCQPRKKGEWQAGQDNVPLIKQNDFAHIKYACSDSGCIPGKTLKTSGCGVMALAMTLKYYNHSNINIPAIAKYAVDTGFRYPDGTKIDFFPQYARNIGYNYFVIKSTPELGLSNDAWGKIEYYLINKVPVIVSGAGNAPFTSNGHYVVLTGIADGLVRVNDSSGGSERNNKSYKAEDLKPRINRAVAIFPKGFLPPLTIATANPLNRFAYSAQAKQGFASFLRKQDALED